MAGRLRVDFLKTMAGSSRNQPANSMKDYMTMATTNELLAIAIQHLQAGRLEAAESVYKQVLAIDPQQADAYHFLGIVAFQVGNLESAIQYIRHAIGLRGTDPAFYSNLGNVLQASGRLDDAVACYRKTLELKPDSIGAYINMGNTLQDQGKLEQSIACYSKALKLNPNSAEVHNYLGDALKNHGKLEAAIASYRQALKWRPDYVEAHNNLGVALSKQGELEASIACYRRALELKPDYAESYSNLGSAFKDQGKLDEALACYDRALELKPDFAEVHSNLGVVLHEQFKLDEAVASYRRALEISPDCVGVLSNLGNALRDQGKLDASVTCYRKALELDADFAEAHCNLGIALKDMGKLEDAAACYRRALELKTDYPEANFGLGLVYMLSGNWKSGWPKYEWRWRTKGFSRRPYLQPQWDGSPLAGKTILLYAEQGLGDTLQFIRYASIVKQFGCTVLVQCQRSLLGLLDGIPGVDQWIDDSKDLPSFDFHCPLMSVPGVLKTSIDTIPASIPYLIPKESLVEKWKKRMMEFEGFRIGICWQGNRNFRDDRERSVPLKCFEPLANTPGVCLINLQKGEGIEQLNQLRNAFSITDFGDELDRESGPFLDTAAVMKNLDLVVTVDTVTGHLAGALGVPVWVALPNVPHWPWLLDRADTPWYPTMRLFRKREEAWYPVFLKMVEALIVERLPQSSS